MRWIITTLALLSFICPIHAQIITGSELWISTKRSGSGASCNDITITPAWYIPLAPPANPQASCTATAACNPGNVFAGVTIQAKTTFTCSNQSVENEAATVQWSPTEIRGIAQAIGEANGWLLGSKDRGADCNLGVTIYPPDINNPADCFVPPAPPPPPPTCTGCNTCLGCRPVGCSSPVVIDLLDEGIHFTNLQNGVQFDLNGDGKPLYLSWTDPKYHNAWLALDRNHNGTIDSAQELFGYLTEPQLPSRDGKRNGWLALAIYDEPSHGGNGDGVIDANDAIYSDLLLWIDTSHDGISQPGELHHLAEMGVIRIPLTYTHKSYTDNNGNNFRFENFIGIESSDIQNKLGRHQAWDVVLDASEDSPSQPRALTLCSPVN
jgi:hypothetical protein